MKLRAHHGLCVRHFVGEGYSGDFIENMKNVIKALQDESEIQVVKSPDRICESCPHNEHGICASMEQVDAYDTAILHICGIQEGDMITFGAYKDAIQKFIIEADRLGEVCRDCEWFALCRSVERGMK